MSTSGNQDVVVGIDGSPASDAALARAVLEATRRAVVAARRASPDLVVTGEGANGTPRPLWWPSPSTPTRSCWATTGAVPSSRRCWCGECCTTRAVRWRSSPTVLLDPFAT